MPPVAVTSFLAYGITQNGEFMKIFHFEKNFIISAYRYNCMLDVHKFNNKSCDTVPFRVAASSYLYLRDLRLISGGLKLSRLAQTRGI